MKKAKTIFLVLFALFFFSKNLSAYVMDSSKSFSYTIDMEESDPVEKSGKDTPTEKEKSEDWLNSPSVDTVETNTLPYSFRSYKENSFLNPYFEISPRPPQLNFIF